MLMFAKLPFGKRKCLVSFRVGWFKWLIISFTLLFAIFLLKNLWVMMYLKEVDCRWLPAFRSVYFGRHATESGLTKQQHGWPYVTVITFLVWVFTLSVFRIYIEMFSGYKVMNYTFKTSFIMNSSCLWMQTVRISLWMNAENGLKFVLLPE